MNATSATHIRINNFVIITSRESKSVVYFVFQGLAAKEGSNRYDGLHGMSSGHQSRRHLREEFVIVSCISLHLF